MCYILKDETKATFLLILKIHIVGIPWRSSGWDSAFSLPRAWVQSLVGELRSHKPRGAAKK